MVGLWRLVERFSSSSWRRRRMQRRCWTLNDRYSSVSVFRLSFVVLPVERKLSVAVVFCTVCYSKVCRLMTFRLPSTSKIARSRLWWKILEIAWEFPIRRACFPFLFPLAQGLLVVPGFYSLVSCPVAIGRNYSILYPTDNNFVFLLSPGCWRSVFLS